MKRNGEAHHRALPPPPGDYLARVPRIAEAVELVNVGPDHFGRDAFLCPVAALAWRAMQSAAAADGQSLLLLSAFRSIGRQAALLSGKLESGMSIGQALAYSAYPGFSEHHSGRAIDIGSPEAAHLEEAFDQTAAFRWLTGHAAAFGFALSYPPGNRHGIAYEPWHWCFHEKPGILGTGGSAGTVL